MSKSSERFGKYILLEKLGGGGMAEVFLAKSTGAGGIAKFVAIKRIQPQFSNDPDFIDMFKDEAKITINLKHNNVLSIFEFGVEGGQFYLVMDYVEGRNLRQILNHIGKQNLGLTPEQIVYIIREVAAGLDHAHRTLDGTTGRPLNIIHRDISPQNIMASFEGEVKIIDFGIAKAESQIETTRSGTLKGKFGYMSPEQAEGLQVDLRTDIFSLGIVLWELLANDRLFASTDEINTLRKIRDCNIPKLRKINPNIDPELERICTKALMKDRNLRYQTASEMHRDLSKFLNLHYPEFSPQDLASFMKQQYSGMVNENRRKLVEYAKIQIAPLSRLEKENTKTQTESASIPKSSPIKEQEPPANLVKTSKPYEVNLESLKVGSSDDLKKRIINEFTSSTIYSPTNRASKITQTRTRSGTINPQTQRTGTVNGTRTQLKPATSASSMNFASLAIAVLVIVGVGFFIFRQNGVQNLIAKWTHSSSGKIEKREMAMEARTFTLSIQSEPMGAAIYINGEPTDQYTPAMISYRENEKFLLSLKKDGYLPYDIYFTLTDNAPFTATLMKNTSGFVDISILNEGATPILTINGKRLSEPLPITSYAVPANERLVIRADNPYTKSCDEKVVQLKSGEKEKVVLILRHPIVNNICQKPVERTQAGQR